MLRAITACRTGAVGDRALRVRIVRPDPRDGPVLRQPALPDVPAGQDPGLARETDRSPAAVPLLPGHVHAAGGAARPGSQSPARGLRRAVRGLQRGAARPWQPTPSSSARIASASSASCTPGAGRWSITRTCTTWCPAAASATTARAGCRRGPTSSCRCRPCRSSSGPSSATSSSARACWTRSTPRCGVTTGWCIRRPPAMAAPRCTIWPRTSSAWRSATIASSRATTARSRSPIVGAARTGRGR